MNQYRIVFKKEQVGENDKSMRPIIQSCKFVKSFKPDQDKKPEKMSIILIEDENLNQWQSF